MLKRRINTRRIREPHIKEVCRILKREQQQGLPHVKKKREQPRGSRLEKKKIAKRELYMEKKKKESKMLPPFKEIISMCMRVKKNKRNFPLAVRHT